MLAGGIQIRPENKQGTLAINPKMFPPDRPLFPPLKAKNRLQVVQPGVLITSNWTKLKNEIVYKYDQFTHLYFIGNLPIFQVSNHRIKSSFQTFAKILELQLKVFASSPYPQIESERPFQGALQANSDAILAQATFFGKHQGHRHLWASNPEPPDSSPHLAPPQGFEP